MLATGQIEKIMALILDGTVGATFPAGGVGNTASAGVGTTDTQALTNKTLALAAGTTSVAPLTLNSSSSAILSTQTVGAIEYDGNTMYAIPQTSGRGVIPSMNIFCLTSSGTGPSTTTPVNIFGSNVSNTSWSPSVLGISYMFEINIGMTKTAGATSHTIAFGFALGTGTAISSIWYRGTSFGFPTSSTISGYNANVGQFAANTNASTVCSGAINNAAAHFSMTINGVFSFSGLGTVIPQFTLSAAPGGTYSVLPGSYMAVWSIGQQAGPGGGGPSAIRVGRWS